MLAIFEQIASKQASSELEPEGPTEIPPDFPEMNDSFQLPVAYHANNQRNEQEARQTQSEIGSNSIVGGRGRGRVFNTAGSGQSRDNGWNGQSRTRPRSDNDYDWRKPGNGDQSPPNDEWANQSANGSVSPNQQSTQGGGAADTWGNNKKNPQNRNGTYWNKGNRNDSNRGWNRGSKMPEWLDTDTSEGGAFDHTGNFTEDRRQSRSFDEDNHVNAVDHVITDRPGSGDSPKENSLEKDDDVFEERNQQLQQQQQQQQAMAQPQPVSSGPNQGQTSASGGWFEALMMEWFYKDPSNNIQGPFSSNDMAEWFEAGYFKKDLLIRRSCDQEFLSLGQVETRYGSNPFRSTRHPPAFLTPPPPASTTISRPPGMGALAPPSQPSPVQPVTTTTTPSTVGGGWAAAPTQPAAPQQPTLTRAPQPVA